MHAGRILSQKRKYRLEQRRRSRLNSGLNSVDLSSASEESPWYLDKWIERRSAFASAKNTKGLSLFHLFGSIALIGVGLILLSITVLTVPGLLEIGVSVFLLSIFCLIFVRCDDDKTVGEDESDEDVLDDVVIETHKTSNSTLSTNASGSDVDENARDQIRANLLRSNPRRIPSPVRGYVQNFSPITEVSEPSSCASSYLTKSYEISKLAKSHTNDSLRSNRVGGMASSISGGGLPGGSPIEEEEDHHFEDDPGGQNQNQGSSGHGASTQSLDSNTSFDTEEDSSVTADLSVLTVLEKKGCSLGSSRELSKEEDDSTPRGSFDGEEDIFEAE